MPTIKLSEQCGRCPREELTVLSAEDAVARVKQGGSSRPPALEVRVDGQVVARYDYLCEECRGITGAAIEGVKPQTKRSARRFKRVVAERDPREAGGLRSARGA